MKLIKMTCKFNPESYSACFTFGPTFFSCVTPAVPYGVAWLEHPRNPRVSVIFLIFFLLPPTPYLFFI